MKWFDRIRLAALVCCLALVAAGLPFAGAVAAPVADDTCTFAFGFAELKARLQDWMGDPTSCEFPDPNGSGDVHQRTGTGLAFWRKSTNTPTFTDGWQHWALGSDGLVTWTGDSIDPTANATP